MSSNPLTAVVAANTVLAVISEDWPPIHADKAITIVVPLLLWAAYMIIEWWAEGGDVSA